MTRRPQVVKTKDPGATSGMVRLEPHRARLNCSPELLALITELVGNHPALQGALLLELMREGCQGAFHLVIDSAHLAPD